MINILVLGHKGMLGHMVCKLFNRNTNYKVSTIDERFPNWNKEMFDGIDFVINCIGAIPQKINKFDINWELPIWLNNNTNCKIIHPSTDCEYDNSDYGVSKRIATDYIKDYCKKTKIIQTSIIGPELNSNDSLLEWFLSQKGEVEGYTKAIWNGVTTLEWAKQCLNLMNNWDKTSIVTILSSDKISKFRLLHTIQECYGKTDVIIMPKELGKDKSLSGNIKTKKIGKQILELIKFNNKNY
jgi:dTDP-4-dehydrorhamnose reductase